MGISVQPWWGDVSTWIEKLLWAKEELFGLHSDQVLLPAGWSRWARARAQSKEQWLQAMKASRNYLRIISGPAGRQVPSSVSMLERRKLWICGVQSRTKIFLETPSPMFS